jgi:peptidoglycan/LPS O-acetylase OafA/YrhL
MWGRITKLYPLFALIVVPWSVAAAVLLGPFHFLRQFGLQFLLMFLGLSPFCGYDLPPVGPWWFIPFIIEFYAIWPLLRWLTSRFGWPALVLLSVAGLVLTYTLDPILAPRLVNLLETPIGRLPVLCFGIFAARYPVRISFPVAACSAALVLLGSRYQVMWLLTPLAVLLVILWSYVFLRDRLRNSNFLLRLGEYSLLTFLVNGIVRNQFLRFPTLPESQIVWGLVSACVSFFIAGIVHEWIRPRRQRVRIFEPVPSEAVEVVS